jgi:hypothetical protein
MIADISGLLALPRPEYAKQTELVLTDILWNSPGTSIGVVEALSSLDSKPEDGKPSRRLVLSKRPGGSPLLTETEGWAREAGRIGIFGAEASADIFSAAALNSILAPSSKRDKSSTCVPVHRGTVPLQTLNGAVNKDNPPDLARAVDVMAFMGGAADLGEAGLLLARAFDDRGDTHADAFMEAVGAYVWGKLGIASPPAWPGTLANPLPLQQADGKAAMSQGLGAAGPPGWFWEAWMCLMDPANGWRMALPERRFADWATCILRTGLALTYLWEASVFRALRDFVGDGGEHSWERLRGGLGAPKLLAIQPRGTPVGDMNISNLLVAGLGDGYYARSALLEAVDELPSVQFDLSAGREAAIAKLAHVNLDPDLLSRDPKNAPKTMREFVRYLLLARAADDADADEADLYYLARSRGRYTWVEPGPEWIVVVASLAAGKPGQQCTLGDVARRLARLGIVLDRATLVHLLEEAGLTQDSPDADEALVVNSGF